jgi:Protein of unknown function (DUF2950)
MSKLMASTGHIIMTTPFTALSARGALAAGLFLCLGTVGAQAQQTFATPEAALDTLVTAAKTHEPGSIVRIFGDGARDVLLSGDADVDKDRLDKFNAAAADAAVLQSPNDNTRIIVLGAGQWPFPIPLVKKGDQWAFDLAAGKTEIEDRAIGEDELSAIEACHTYIDAQREYFRDAHDGDDVRQYARRFISSPGKHDGLYWDSTKLSEMSPLGTRLVNAGLEKRVAGDDSPYQGYHFRILTRQGPSAPGGAFDYVINGRMIAGFALLAFPADWNKTGVMSFVCGNDGPVHQKDLGPNTANVAAGLTSYDPDKSWSEVQE